jgi:tRNA pseudouridine38-40 synthase
MPRYLLDLDLAGRAFAGTQTQKNQRTVQTELETAIAGLDGDRRHVRLASRLDSGVDAEHLPCDVALERIWDPAVLCQALTDRLPADLAIRRAAIVADGFNAISDATGKTYRYRITLRPVRPVRDTRCWWLRRLDRVDLLQTCADLLVGRKDLSGFANLRHDDSDSRDPVRTITSAGWRIEPEPDGKLLTFHVSGDGFLYRQVRGFVGGMAAVATGRWPLDDFAACCAGGRQAAKIGNVAPADGLCLEQVRYEPEPAWVVAAS